MRITIAVNGHLKRTSALGSSRRDYDANQGCTVRDLLTEFNICESEVRRVFRNGRKARLDTKLRSRDHLELF
jgi:hypothetical protein